MCGICGYVASDGLKPTVIHRMTDRVAYRGPDGEGYWLWNRQSDSNLEVMDGWEVERQPPACVALGHRRLAIIDLGPEGRQPMRSLDGSCWVVLNGEIFNYVELREVLVRLGHVFRTRTDTEVVLAAWQQWGPECFRMFNGMWGLGLVDLRRGTLVLSRDRLGVKPLYVWCRPGLVAFASEIKQFLDVPGFTPRLNPDAVAEYVDTGYEHPPATFFEGVTAFPPGHWAEIRLDAPKSPKVQSYWEPPDTDGVFTTREEATAKFRELWTDAVRLRLRADVPVGVCLSGGLDSSAVFVQVKRILNGGARPWAFSVFFDDPACDERQYVAEVLAQACGIGHHVVPTPQMFLAEQDAFVYHHDEPPGSLSVFAAYRLMRLARDHGVPVLLNGQGGDELFGGYWVAYYQWLANTLVSAPLKFVRDVAGMLLPGGNREIVWQLVPHWQRYRSRRLRASRALLGPALREAGFTLNRNWAVESRSLSPAAYRLCELRRIHLPRLLKWEDRNGMAHAVEGRYPFLDFRLVEWAVSLPPEFNLCRGWNKWIIREGLSDELPRIVRERRDKIGFSTPRRWVTKDLARALQAWALMPSDRFRELCDVGATQRLADKVLGRRADTPYGQEDELTLMRLYFLDRWLQVFNVQ